MRRAGRARSGFTLIEVVLASIILGVLMAAMGSVVALSTRALPDREDGVGPSVVVADVLDQFVADVSEATLIVEHGPHDIEMRVPDRTGDGQPETVRYSWSGEQGQPLVRSVNGGRPIMLVREVESVVLEYARSKHSITLDGDLVESDMTRLASVEEASSDGNRAINEDEWAGQHFTPSIPDEAERWSIHRVDIRMSSSGPADGHAWLRVREATSDGLPGGAVLAEALIVEDDLNSSMTWEQFDILGTQRINPNVRPVLTIEHIDDTHSCAIRIAKPSPMPSGVHLLESGDGGASWSKDEASSLFFRVIGTYSVRGEPQTLELEYIERVRLRLVPAGWDVGGFETSVRLPGGVRVHDADADSDDDEDEDGS